MQKRVAVVALIGLLMAAGLVLTGCEESSNCTGTGECTITIGQGTTGLYVDTSAERSSCGTTTSGSSTGCIVADMNSLFSTNRRAGTHKCNC